MQAVGGGVGVHPHVQTGRVQNLTVAPGGGQGHHGVGDAVPDQDPQKIGDLFEAYLRKICPKTVELKITRMHGGNPWMTEFDNKFVRAAGRAIEQGFGKTPVFNREGGSIPVMATFQRELGIPGVLFGVGLPDENAHAPDEKLDLGNFHNGIIASAFLYQEIANTN